MAARERREASVGEELSELFGGVAGESIVGAVDQERLVVNVVYLCFDVERDNDIEARDDGVVVSPGGLLDEDVAYPSRLGRLDHVGHMHVREDHLRDAREREAEERHDRQPGRGGSVVVVVVARSRHTCARAEGEQIHAALGKKKREPRHSHDHSRG